MAATLSQVLDGIADQIRDQLSSVTDITIHVEGRAFLAADLPAVDVWPSSPQGIGPELAGFRDNYGGWPLNLRVRVSPGDLEAGESLLYALMDDGDDELSLIAALNYDRTIGGILDTLSWGEWLGMLEFTAPDERGGIFIGSILPLVAVKAQS